MELQEGRHKYDFYHHHLHFDYNGNHHHKPCNVCEKTAWATHAMDSFNHSLANIPSHHGPYFMERK